MEEKATLGKFIANRRKHLRLTQEALAQRIGVSKSAIAKWETDGGVPDRDNLKRLAEIMNVSVDLLHNVMGSSGNMANNQDINITADIIATLEFYGYKVIRPGEMK
ncbi:MAG: helix-turn-helix transcriptional regulator [Lachnospiraceae bacterium]|nr:helix-turn-helix transcriptional regulator [Lachnospiraceae bacterium]MBR6151896.1 helix-turn-helix transcriptional regulator [Lachnospiraceae bacterium]